MVKLREQSESKSMRQEQETESDFRNEDTLGVRKLSEMRYPPCKYPQVIPLRRSNAKHGSNITVQGQQNCRAWQQYNSARVRVLPSTGAVLNAGDLQAEGKYCS